MNAEEWVRLVDQCFDYDLHDDCPGLYVDQERLEATITDIITAAAEAEREACLKACCEVIAVGMGGLHDERTSDEQIKEDNKLIAGATICAQAIRNRSKDNG